MKWPAGLACSSSGTRLAGLAALAGAAMLVPGLSTDSGQTASPPPDSGVALPALMLSPDPIDLGTIRAGMTGRSAVRLTNRGGRSITIDRTRSSCPGVALHGLPVVVPADGEASVTVVYDPAEEPGFRGGLSVELTGYDGEAVVFGTRVLLEVAP